MADNFVKGAGRDLESQIDTHLFIISVNNSGSTFLRRSFEISPSVWWLEREGQHSLGFPGPYTRDSRDALVWNATEQYRARYLAADAYDWEGARKAWYFQATARSAEASIFVTSSPPFLLNVDALDRHFRGARFIVLSRHPLAIAEGILRRPIERRLPPGADRVAVAATHIGECFVRLAALVDEHRPNLLSLSYEDVYDHPAIAEQHIKAFVPGLSGYTLDQEVAVKRIYKEKPRNMNADGLARLDPEVRVRLEAALAPYAEAIARLGYGAL